MFSLQQLFGKSDRFYQLLEASALEAQESVQLLLQLLRTHGQSSSLDDFILSRRKEKKIASEISQQLVKTFITELEREDIEALSNALYKIPKSVEKFAERYNLAAPRLAGVDFTRQAELMAKATDTVVALVKQLRDIRKLERVKELNDRLQYLEGEGDRAIVALLGDLYSGTHDTLTVVIVKDLYELIEKVIDRCRDAGNVILQIVLKNA
jgi:hypothetical protein